MNKYIQIFISGLIAGLIASVGGLLAVVTSMPAVEHLTDIQLGTWLTIAGTGLLTALKDWKTFNADPPTDNNVIK